MHRPLPVVVAIITTFTLGCGFLFGEKPEKSGSGAADPKKPVDKVEPQPSGDAGAGVSGAKVETPSWPEGHWNTDKIDSWMNLYPAGKVQIWDGAAQKKIGGKWSATKETLTIELDEAFVHLGGASATLGFTGALGAESLVPPGVTDPAQALYVHESRVVHEPSTGKGGHDWAVGSWNNPEKQSSLVVTAGGQCKAVHEGQELGCKWETTAENRLKVQFTAEHPMFHGTWAEITYIPEASALVPLNKTNADKRFYTKQP